jgi:hypothetical protein
VALTPSITKRKRKRHLRSGALVTQTRYVVNFREPRSGRRTQFFFTRYEDAVAKREALLSSVATNAYAAEKADLTVAQAVGYWLQTRQGEVKKATFDSYEDIAAYVVGPLLLGTAHQRRTYTRSGEKPAGTRLLEMLGPKKIRELMTADVRRWHQDLTSHVSGRTANVGTPAVMSASTRSRGCSRRNSCSKPARTRPKRTRI